MRRKLWRSLQCYSLGHVQADAAVILVAIELGVVKGVEGVCTELQLESLCEGKGLKERKIPVLAARTTECIKSLVAVAVLSCSADSAGRFRERRRIEPFADLFRVSDFPDQVGRLPVFREC